MNRKPIEFKKLSNSSLQISWNDGSTQTIDSQVLRTNCPCAGCREQRGDESHSKPLQPKKSLLKIIEHTKDEETSLELIWPVGNYALGLKWKDGHDSGIYTYQLLSELGNKGKET